MNSSVLSNIFGSTSLAFITGIFSMLSMISCKWLAPVKHPVCLSCEDRYICPYNSLNSRPIYGLFSVVATMLSGYGCYKQLTFEKRMQNLTRRNDDLNYRAVLGFFSGLFLSFAPFIKCRPQNILEITSQKMDRMNLYG